MSPADIGRTCSTRTPCGGLNPTCVVHALAAAIDARHVALRKWQDIHDTDRVWNRANLIDAAALGTEVETDPALSFDDVTFGDLVAHVAKLPT